MSLTLEESRLHKAYDNLENLARHPADPRGQPMRALTPWPR